MADILIMDDDKSFCDRLARIVERMGHQVSCTHTIKDTLTISDTNSFDVVLLDVVMPDGNGLDLIPHFREAPTSPEIVIITADGDPNGAEIAIRSGAWDYIEKPLQKKTLSLTLLRALKYHKEKSHRKKSRTLLFDGVIGSSSVMQDCCDLTIQAAGGNVNVLVTGETGTGKELFALAIHNNSQRSQNNFVVVDCTALPENLIESILFGHEKGAFTGAEKRREGLIKQADGGTLFLDEVGELPLAIQKTFLRVLQERRFTPLGAGYEVKSDFRLVAATNRDLAGMVKESRFREDLYFRLKSLTIHLPPLRERNDDIRDIATHLMSQHCKRFGYPAKSFAPDFFEGITKYNWPGNVRELGNALENSVTSAQQDTTIFLHHLPKYLRIKIAQASLNYNSSDSKRFNYLSDELPDWRSFKNDAVSKLEKQYVNQLLFITNNNIKEACKISDLSRPRLYAIMKKLGVSRNELPNSNSAPAG